jgi:hypothetical protein
MTERRRKNIEYCIIHKILIFVADISFHFSEEMSTTSAILLLDNERKAQWGL